MDERQTVVVQKIKQEARVNWLGVSHRTANMTGHPMM
jgi:hypothetical protein